MELIDETLEDANGNADDNDSPHNGKDDRQRSADSAQRISGERTERRGKGSGDSLHNSNTPLHSLEQMVDDITGYPEQASEKHAAGQN